MSGSPSVRGRVAFAHGDTPLEVLIADADPRSRGGLAIAVRALGYTCEAARSGAEALAMHSRHPADIILADPAMPDVNGLELCRAIRAQRMSAYTYVVYLAPSGDKNELLEVMRAGADGHLNRPVDLEELEVQLEAGRRIIGFNRALEAKNRRLQGESERALLAANVDPVTGVSSRRQLEEDLAILQSGARRHGQRWCAALCDVDGFKHYNDHFGHLAGDAALRGVACAMRTAIRRSDGLYRYGGDEFLAILHEHSLHAAGAVMERVRDAVEALRIHQSPKSDKDWLTISVGVAESRRATPESIQLWLKRADAALYVAKAGGRNRVSVDSRSSAA
jgi:diguanylate cyclase (GGDEF)-like protein